MTTQKRVNDIMTTNLFKKDEIVHIDKNNNTFESWEYSVILYYTNKELNSLDASYKNKLLSKSDDIENTSKGRMYCFK